MPSPAATRTRARAASSGAWRGPRSRRLTGIRPCAARRQRLDRCGAISYKARPSGGFRPPVWDAQVAQSVEQRTENPRVGGSNPPLGTMHSPTNRRRETARAKAARLGIIRLHRTRCQPMVRPGGCSSGPSDAAARWQGVAERHRSARAGRWLQAAEGAGDGERQVAPGSVGPDAGQADPRRGCQGKRLSPARRRACVDHVMAELGVSERRACRTLGQAPVHPAQTAHDTR